MREEHKLSKTQKYLIYHDKKQQFLTSEKHNFGIFAWKITNNKTYIFLYAQPPSNTCFKWRKKN